MAGGIYYPEYTRVSGLALQTDGKILVAGGFTNLAGQASAVAVAVHAVNRGVGSGLPVVVRGGNTGLLPFTLQNVL